MRRLRQEFQAGLCAVLFFTRLPLHLKSAPSADDFRRSAAYFPWVGWLVGGVAAAMWWTAQFCFPPAVAAGLALAATALLTGAMHEDALADVCDGFGGGTTPERILAIMKDPNTGAFGAVGLVLGLKWQVLASLPSTLVPSALLAGHALSRAAAISLLASLDYVRTGPNKAGAIVSRLHPARLAIALAGGLASLALLPQQLHPPHPHPTNPTMTRFVINLLTNLLAQAKYRRRHEWLPTFLGRDWLPAGYQIHVSFSFRFIPHVLVAGAMTP
ncbi:MAG: adenosylcobinamide-GDP ribazoletransferase [Opitutaceae bacterium]|jgi:adenosylcobinamide-GDP ribazoletransferase